MSEHQGPGEPDIDSKQSARAASHSGNNCVDFECVTLRTMYESYYIFEQFSRKLRAGIIFESAILSFLYDRFDVGSKNFDFICFFEKHAAMLEGLEAPEENGSWFQAESIWIREMVEAFKMACSSHVV